MEEFSFTSLARQIAIDGFDVRISVTAERVDVAMEQREHRDRYVPELRRTLPGNADDSHIHRNLSEMRAIALSTPDRNRNGVCVPACKAY